MSTLLEQMKKDLYEGKADKVKAATRKALAEGMTPVFPMLDPSGSYWSLAYLEAFLAGMDRCGKGELVRKLALAVNFSSSNRPLDWGAGGPSPAATREGPGQ